MTGISFLTGHKTQRPHPCFCLKTDIIFSPVWPTAHMYLVKTIPKNVSFQKCSPGLKSLKTPAFCLRVDGRKRRFSDHDVIHHKYIINHISIVFNSVFMWTSENDLNTVCVDVYFFLIFKNIWIHVDRA